MILFQKQNVFRGMDHLLRRWEISKLKLINTDTKTRLFDMFWSIKFEVKSFKGVWQRLKKDCPMMILFPIRKMSLLFLPPLYITLKELLVLYLKNNRLIFFFFFSCNIKLFILQLMPKKLRIYVPGKVSIHNFGFPTFYPQHCNVLPLFNLHLDPSI